MQKNFRRCFLDSPINIRLTIKKILTYHSKGGQAKKNIAYLSQEGWLSKKKILTYHSKGGLQVPCGCLLEVHATVEVSPIGSPEGVQDHRTKPAPQLRFFPIFRYFFRSFFANTEIQSGVLSRLWM